MRQEPKFRQDTMFIRDTTSKNPRRFSTNNLVRIGVLSEKQAKEQGFSVVYSGQPYYDKYKQRLKDQGITVATDKSLFIKWAVVDLTPTELKQAVNIMRTDYKTKFKADATMGFTSGLESSALGSDHLYDLDKAHDAMTIVMAKLSGKASWIPCMNLSSGAKDARVHSVEQVEALFNDLLVKQEITQRYYERLNKLNKAESVKEILAI